MSNKKHFNGLTPAEAERLAMLAEEAGEIVQVVGKILRHGYESHHPLTPDVTNRELLNRELKDFGAVLRMMKNAKDLPFGHSTGLEKVAAQKMRWTHHQGKTK